METISTLLTVDSRAGKAKYFLEQLLAKRISGSAQIWLEKVLSELSGTNRERIFFMAFSAASRYISKDKIFLDANEHTDANEILDGWNIRNWSVDQCVRTFLVLSLPADESFKGTLTKLFGGADVTELMALYACLPVLPSPELFADRASEGVRVNITPVFDSVVLDNPYPYLYLNEDAWNQMVLKSIFNSRPLDRIYGLDNRANGKLASMLCSFAHERWAAGRSVAPELWRCVGPFINSENFADIKKIFNSEIEAEQHAAALACYASNYPEAKTLLLTRPDLVQKIESREISWNFQ